ncbi:MAG: hypothetical protein GF384_06720, partial [Elusimicrobia bacterium]|nr:hypothetical protein [Elusimicrobiota bacterium]
MHTAHSIMRSYRPTLKRIASLIKHNKTFFIAGHRRPDGDSIAAQLALGSILKKLRKKFDIVSRDPVPRNLMFLPGANRITVAKRITKTYDVAFILECSGQDRMGNIIDLKAQAKQVINIDHHTHFNCFGDENLIDPDASSSCEIIYHLFETMHIPLSRNVALYLYVGLITDTGCFHHANTTAQVHQLAAECLTCGVKPVYVYEKVYQQRSLKELGFLGEVLKSIRLILKGKAALITIKHKHTDTEDIVNYGMMISSVLVTVLLQPGSKRKLTRVSFRSRG